jgi:hypothetical protein
MAKKAIIFLIGAIFVFSNVIELRAEEKKGFLSKFFKQKGKEAEKGDSGKPEAQKPSVKTRVVPSDEGVGAGGKGGLSGPGPAQPPRPVTLPQIPQPPRPVQITRPPQLPPSIPQAPIPPRPPAVVTAPNITRPPVLPPTPPNIASGAGGPASRAVQQEQARIKEKKKSEDKKKEENIRGKKEK